MCCTWRSICDTSCLYRSISSLNRCCKSCSIDALFQRSASDASTAKRNVWNSKLPPHLHAIAASFGTDLPSSRCSRIESATQPKQRKCSRLLLHSQPCATSLSSTQHTLHERFIISRTRSSSCCAVGRDLASF